MGSFIFGVLLLLGAFIVWKFVPASPNRESLKKVSAGALVLVSVFFMVISTVFISDSDKNYVIQFPTGTMKVVTNDAGGITFSGLGKVYWYHKVLAVSTPMFTKEKTGFDEGTEEELSTVDSLSPPTVRFSDAAKADFYGIARVQLPTDEERMLRIHKEFGSSEALVNNLLKSTFYSAAINSARLMSIQEYITKRGSDFDEYFSDQFMNGLYKTQVTQEVQNSVGAKQGNKMIVDGEITNRDGVKTESSDQITEVVRLVIDPTTNLPRRQGINDITAYGLNVITARVTYVNPEQKVRELIGKQRDAEAAAALAENARRKSLLEAEAAKAEGQKLVAQEEATQLVDQIKTITQAETDKKKFMIESQKNLEVAKLEKKAEQERLEKAVIEAKKIKELANAEAYQKRVIMEADNALQQKLDTWLAAQKEYSAAMKDIKVATTVIGSSEKGGAMGGAEYAHTMLTMMGIKAAKDLDLDMSVKK